MNKICSNAFKLNILYMYENNVYLQITRIKYVFVPDKCPDDKFEKDGKCIGKCTLVKPY